MTYENALAIAQTAHRDQTDKAGRPYIEHPLAVARSVDTPEQKITALLHDVLEDSAYTEQELARMGVPKPVLNAVVLLTRRPGQNYGEYLARLKSNRLARTVKMADLRHNMDLSRLPRPGQKDRDRSEKYRNALSFLQETIIAPAPSL